MKSPAFERFRFSFFEDAYSAHDGLDANSLASLEGDERSQAADMLLAYLPDMRGVIGLGILRAPQAEPVLTKLLAAERAEGVDDIQVYLAKALWQIRPDPRWLEPIIEVLGCSEEPYHRIQAAIALYSIRDPAVVPALLHALDDPEMLARHHAARALLELHRVPRDKPDPQHMMYRIMSDDAARREGGKRDILEAIAGRAVSAA
jgi:HEAT repeat protein